MAYGSLEDNDSDTVPMLGDETDIIVDRDDNDNGNDTKAGVYATVGILLAVLSKLFYSLSGVFVKMTEGLHPIQINMFVQFVEIICIIPILFYKKTSIHGNQEDWPLLWLRGIASAFTVSLFYYSCRHLPLGDLAAIYMNASVVIVILACVMLNERIHLVEVMLMILSTGGVLLVAQPTIVVEIISKSKISNTYHTFGLLAAIGATLAVSIGTIIMRQLRHVHYTTIIFNMCLWNLTISSVVVLILDIARIPNSPIAYLFMAGNGVVSFLGDVCIAEALRLEEAGRVGLASGSGMVFSFIWQIAIFGNYPTPLTIAGAVLVTICTVTLGITRWKCHPAKKLNDVSEL